ncbi:hypothetical protein ASD21_03285 [Caulobacter sp. Root1455]|uniref:DUF1178 family protein n=1 Tax=unclassified Caulobacter TaxID=2648921 RepID=UPI0006F87205|nr:MULTISPECIES: DUF1178 family protein [unclassified Caulobacter]KQY28838.1 hypothetical protein ASD38_14440 [Caulobacter sp. Root487D2Y]KQY98995.1 hypothetical protein ASD21_03285 [Caulobacter sp. Root1455]
MIKYALSCDHDHAFEGWFGSSSDYDDQAARGLLDCPLCGSKTVRKQIMAPAIAGTKAQASTPEPSAQMREMMMTAMGEVRRRVEENFDYVGDSFAKEARDIHDGKSEERGIYGEASPQEVKALVEDGIKIAPLPPAAPKKTEVN